MTTTYATNSAYNSPFDFCALQNDPNQMDTIIKSNPDGLKGDAAQAALKDQDYATVLGKIWAEQEGDFRLTWLREKGDLPFVLAERALAELTANPTQQCVYEVVIPLLNLHSLRTHMDIVCVNDDTLSDSLDLSMSSYKDTIKSRTGKLGLRKIPYFEEEVLVFQKTKDLFENYKARFIQNPDTIPSPLWVKDFGLAGFARALVGEERTTHPKEEWYSRRLEALNEEISSVERQLATSQRRG